MQLEKTPSKIAVIVAGGVGLRMGSDRPKQFLELEGRPILIRTVETFLNSYPDLRVILVLPAEHLDEGKSLLANGLDVTRVQYATGGETRFQSVRNGLQLINESAIVFVQDAVRCLTSVALIRRCYEQARVQGSAIPAIAATDSIRMLEGSQSRSLPRGDLRLIQTPQTFRSEILLPAYQTEYQPVFTDEASVVEHMGTDIHLIEGDVQNIKITSPIDLQVAAAYLRAQ